MLSFIEYTIHDYDDLALVFQNPEVMKFTIDDCYSQEGLREYHKRIMENNSSTDRKHYEFKVIKSNQLIGFADIEIVRKLSKGGIAEIGYLLLPEYWGKGYGALVASELINICFNKFKLHKVMASCHIENIGSWKIMEKVGMKREGLFEAHRLKDGKFVPELKYGILNSLLIDTN